MTTTYHRQSAEPIVLGCGELYLGKVDNPETALEADIVAALKNVGAIESGATLTYTPTVVDVKSANRGKLATYITDEEVIFNCGVMTWIIENLEILSPGSVDVDALTGTKKMKIGGQNNKLPVNYLRFVHPKSDKSGELIVNISRAQSTKGFELNFSKENPLVLNYEFTALSNIGDGTLVEIIETFNA